MLLRTTNLTLLDSSLRALFAKQHLHLRATARSAVQVSQSQSSGDCFVAQHVLHLSNDLLLAMTV
jgi:hypothetical protein